MFFYSIKDLFCHSTLQHIIPSFNDPTAEAFESIVEKEMLFNSILPQYFLLFLKQRLSSQIYFVVCKL